MLAFSAIKGAAWLMLSRSIGRLIDFCTLLFLARSLHPADFGVAALAMSFVMIVDIVLEVPVTQALVRLKSIDKAHLDTAFTLTILRSIVLAVIIVAGAWPYAYFNGDQALFKIVCFLAIAPVVRGFGSPATVHFTRDINFRPGVVIDIAARCAAFVVAMIVVTHGGGYWAIVSNSVTAATISTILSYVMASYRPNFGLKRLADFYTFTGWFSSSQIVAALNWQYDRLMMGFLSADRALIGRYSVANDLSNVPSQSFIGPALQPAMSVFSKISDDKARVRTAFLKASRVAMLAAVPIGVGISLTSDYVASIVLGSTWKDAAPYISMLSLSLLSAPYYQTIYAACLATDRPKVVFKLNAIDLVLRVILLTTGYALYSVEGTALARIILAAAMVAIYMVQMRPTLGLSVIAQVENLWKIAVAGGVMAFVIVGVRPLAAQAFGPMFLQFGLIVLMAGLAYALSLFALGLRVDLRRGSLGLFDKRWKMVSGS